MRPGRPTRVSPCSNPASRLLDRFSRLDRAPATWEMISPREVVETSSISMAETMASSSSFTERATLTALPAYAYEQATGHRRSPGTTPSLPGEP